MGNAGELFLVITSLGKQSSITAFMEGIHLELKLYFSKAKLQLELVLGKLIQGKTGMSKQKEQSTTLLSLSKWLRLFQGLK